MNYRINVCEIDSSPTEVISAYTSSLHIIKTFLFSFLIFGAMLSAQGQSVDFYSQKIEYDNTPLLLSGNFGDWTNYQYVRFNNKSVFSISIRAHLHHHLTFIYFVDDDNNSGHEININIPANHTYTLKVIAKLANGNPVIYNDQLGFDVTYQNNATSYFELEASAYFYTNSDLSFSRPEGYHYWSLNGSPRIVEASSRPLKVYSNHHRYGVNSSWTDIVNKAINTWNNAGKSIGIESIFYELTSNSSDSDLTIDWSGKDLKGEELGAAILSNSNPSRIIGITMRPPGSDNALRTAEVLIQEMGHILGLDHSDNRYDIMNGQAHPLHHEDLSKITLTTRDRQMLFWLYSQKEYIPIVSQKYKWR